MRLAAGALVTLALAVLGLPGAAVGSRVEAGAGNPTVEFAGNDGAGPITFTLNSSESNGKHPKITLTIHKLRFATGCSPALATIKAVLPVDSSDHFWYVARGITLQGTVDGSQATGTLRDAHGCDTGVLSFSASVPD